jgi:hypothetical protein
VRLNPIPQKLWSTSLAYYLASRSPAAPFQLRNNPYFRVQTRAARALVVRMGNHALLCCFPLSPRFLVYPPPPPSHQPRLVSRYGREEISVIG